MLLKTDIEPEQVDPCELAQYYLTSIYQQVRRLKYNYIGSAVGRPRAGKSVDVTFSLTMLDPTFWECFEDRVVYNAQDYMRANIKLMKQRIIGGGINWDEAGVGIPARLWYEQSNRAINFTSQVMGVFRPITFFTTQDLTFIDSQQRKLINALWEVTRSTNDYSIVKVFELQIDRKRGKIYYKYPNFITKDGIHMKLSRGIKLMRPCKEFMKRYEDHSKPFKEMIMNQMAQRTDDIEAGRMGKREYSVNEIMQAIIDNPTIYEAAKSEVGRRILSTDLIKHDFQIQTSLANVIKLRTEQSINRKERTELEKQGVVPPAPTPEEMGE